MNFEDFLTKKWGRSGDFKDPDNAQHFFDEWLGQLDVSDWLEYAEEWGVELAKESRALGRSES